MLCLLGLVMVVWAGAAPTTSSAPGVIPLEKQAATVVPIIEQSEELEANGTFKFSYETGNGIKREETSYDKVLPKAEGRSADKDENNDSNEIHVQQGSYSYTAPDGTLISLRYIADENGFQPIGDHIPKPASLSISASNSEKSGRALDADSSVPALTARSSQGAATNDAKDDKASTTEKPGESTTDKPKETSKTETDNPATTEKPEATTEVGQTESTNASTTDKPAEATTEAAKTDATEATSEEKLTSTTEASTTAAASTTAV